MNNYHFHKRLEELATEFDATMNHAAEVLNEYVDTVFEQAAMEAFNDMTPDEQLALIFGLMMTSEKSDELTDLERAICNAAAEAEVERYEMERERAFFEELEALMSLGLHRR